MKNNVSPLPNCLSRKIICYLLISVVFAVMAVAGTIAAHDARNMVIFLGTIYFLFLAGYLFFRWNQGKIMEVPALCISIQPSKYAQFDKYLTVIFSTGMEDTPTMTFSIPSNGCKYVENISYVLYVDNADHSKIIASEPVA